VPLRMLLRLYTLDALLLLLLQRMLRMLLLYTYAT
jgi:hypothetical protein